MLLARLIFQDLYIFFCILLDKNDKIFMFLSVLFDKFNKSFKFFLHIAW